MQSKLIQITHLQFILPLCFPTYDYENAKGLYLLLSHNCRCTHIFQIQSQLLLTVGICMHAHIKDIVNSFTNAKCVLAPINSMKICNGT